MDWVPSLFQEVGIGPGIGILLGGGALLWFWRATRDIKLSFKGAKEKLEENTEQTTKAVATVKKIESEIVTNHGSKNLGDAIDRLTTNVWDIKDLAQANNGRVTNLEEKLSEHIEIAKTEGEALTQLTAMFQEHLAEYRQRTSESSLMMEFGKMLMQRELGLSEPTKEAKPDAD